MSVSQIICFLQYNYRIIVDDEMNGRDCDFLIPDETERIARNTITRIGGPDNT
jgi:hypothetical protein